MSAGRTLYIHVSGRPVPKARPRFGGQKRRVFTNKRTRWFEERVAWEASLAMHEQGWETTRAPVALRCTFSGAHRSADLTNLIKSVEDAMNSVVWIDDKQVVELQAQFGAEEAGVDIIVTELGPEAARTAPKSPPATT